ncbi:MAG: hypothetical protein EHM58_18220 [Ignavibacteriae bacterium]|nr:MAG: hypothetical protein EHM58_18220 [Ignavibacteriota bacterium]
MDSRQAEQELAVIKTIMEDSRKIGIDKGVHYIFWGVLVTAALIVNYIFLVMGISGPYIGMLWLVLMIGGWVVSAIIGRKENKARKVKTFAGKILSAIWIGAGVSMMMLGFIGIVTHAYNPIFVCPLIATVLGAAYFASGIVQSQNWVRNLSFGWWAGAILMFIFPGFHSLLVFAFMMVALQTVPGIILYRQWKRYESAPAQYV